MKFFIPILTLSILPIFAVAANIEESGKNIYNTDIHIADNARLELQQLKAEKELLEALGKVSDRNLRDGIIYSLGKLKSETAYAKILGIAEKELDKCPAAILALPEYNTSQSHSALKGLESKGSKTAATALWLTKSPEGNLYPKSTFAGFEKLDDNQKVVVLGLANSNTNFLNFLLGYKAQNKRVAIAQCFALGRIDSKNDLSLKKINDIAGEYPDSAADFARALAVAKNSENFIASLIKDGSELGVIAARIRCCIELEEQTLNLYLKTDNQKLRRACAETLQSIAMSATADALSADFNSIKSADLGASVKILSAAISRIDDASKKRLVDKLSASEKSADDIHKTAIAKILK